MLGDDAPRRHPRPPSVRLLRDVGRALRRAGRRGPRGAGDQADGVPHERRLAARPRAHPRRPSAASRRCAWWSSRRASTSGRTSSGRARWRRRACTSSTAIPSLKTHAKCVLIVRREGDGVRHYVHIGTGNYHPTTARLYTDFGLFTCDEEIGADVADMFNFLTGYARPRRYRKVLVAPDSPARRHPRRDRAHDRGPRGEHALADRAEDELAVDRECIEALYRASQAGVRVDLNVRGICCLRPGVEGVSENIRVVSIVGRFLEHSRIFAFERDGDDRRSASARPTSCRATSTRASSWSRRSRTRRCARPARRARALLRRRRERVGPATRTATWTRGTRPGPSRAASSAS